MFLFWRRFVVFVAIVVVVVVVVVVPLLLLILTLRCFHFPGTYREVHGVHFLHLQRPDCALQLRRARNFSHVQRRDDVAGKQPNLVRLRARLNAQNERGAVGQKPEPHGLAQGEARDQHSLFNAGSIDGRSG